MVYPKPSENGPPNAQQRLLRQSNRTSSHVLSCLARARTQSQVRQDLQSYASIFHSFASFICLFEWVINQLECEYARYYIRFVRPMNNVCKLVLDAADFSSTGRAYLLWFYCAFERYTLLFFCWFS